MTSTHPTREQRLDDMAALIEWLREHPEHPIDYSMTVGGSVADSAAVRRALATAEDAWRPGRAFEYMHGTRGPALTLRIGTAEYRMSVKRGESGE